MNKKIYLITGATGFLGSTIVKRLLSLEYYVIGLKRTTSDVKNIKDVLDHQNFMTYNVDVDALEKIFEIHDVHTIVHCATSSANRGGSIPQIFEANVVLPLRLLNSGVKNGLKVFINSGVFIPQNYVDTYFNSKKIFLNSLMEYRNIIKIVDVQLQMLYGKNSSKTQFIANMIEKLLNDVPSIDLTKGEPKRDFIYIEDALDAFLIILNNVDSFKEKYTKIDLGSGESIPIKEVVLKLRRFTGNVNTKLNFGAFPYRDNEIFESKADIRFLKEYGWYPKYSIDEGLKLTVESMVGIHD